MNRSPPTRRSSNYSSSSAFSANANPNEDWTQISDLAERRRIQNRIAQRNYRKKLKRRLEDLEKRAASSSSPDDDGPSWPRPSGRGRGRRTKSIANSVGDTKSERGPGFNYYNNPSIPSIERPTSTYPDDRGSMFAHQSTRQLSASPPPVLSYSSYSHLSPYGTQIYGHSPPFYHSPSFQHTTPAPSFHDLSSFPGSDYSAAPVKRIYADEEIVSPFSMSYANMAGIDLGSTMQHPGSHLPMPPPPLTQSQVDGRSTTPSTPAGMSIGGPLTPEPDPCSPRSFPLF